MPFCYYWKIDLEEVSLVSSGVTYFNFYEVPCGIRQGSVLSLYLFAIYIDSLTKRYVPNY